MNVRFTSLVELILKTDDPIEKGRFLKKLREESNLRITEIASLTDYTPSHVTNLVRLCKLPDLILDGYYAGDIKYTHLLLLSRLPDENSMKRVYEKILSENITTAELQDIVRYEIHGIATEGEKVQQEVVNNISNSFKQIDQDISVNVIQTKVQATIIMKVKGNNKKTSSTLMKIAKRIKDIT